MHVVGVTETIATPSRSSVFGYLARKCAPDCVSSHHLGNSAATGAAWPLVRPRRLAPHCRRSPQLIVSVDQAERGAILRSNITRHGSCDGAQKDRAKLRSVRCWQLNLKAR